MSKSELCDGELFVRLEDKDLKGRSHTFNRLVGGAPYVPLSVVWEETPLFGVFAENRKLASVVIGKRKKLKCPKCGRRVTPMVSMCHDGCCYFLSLPKHKPKEWWKNDKR